MSHVLETCSVIGASGFIGSALVTRLKEEGLCPREFVRTDEIPKGENLGTVFYCAGMTADFLENPADTLNAHTVLLSEILFKRSADKLIYLSSTRLYDELTEDLTGFEDSDLSVNPSKPRHFFDLTKLAGEALCNVCDEMPTQVLRLAAVYSETHYADGFMGSILKKICEADPGSEIYVDSSPLSARDYIHLDDVLTACLLVAESGKASVYNVASGVNVTNLELSELFHDRTGRKLIFTDDVRPPEFCRIETERLWNEFGFRARSIETALDAWLTAF